MNKQELLEKIKEQINSNTGIVVFSDYTEYSLIQAIRDSNDILCNIRKMLEAEETEEVTVDESEDNAQIINEITALINENRIHRTYNTYRSDCEVLRNNNETLAKARTVIKNVGKKSYERGLNDAWELARKIGCSIPNGGYTIAELKMIFGSMDMCDVFNDNSTCQEALAKVEAYEKKKAEEEAKKLVAGDVVEYCSNRSKTAVFLYEDFGNYWVLNEAGECPQKLSKDRFTLKKTGKHVDLEGLFAGIKEE